MRAKRPMSFGIILVTAAVLLVLTTGCSNVLGKFGSLFGGNKDAVEYDCLADKWTNEFVTEKIAVDDAYDRLLKAAEDGDKKAFADCFTKELRDSSGFDMMVDDFFANYPEGLGKAEIKRMPAGAGGSIRGNTVISNASSRANVRLNGEYYDITLRVCYEYTGSPEKIGVRQFAIRNLEADAEYIDRIQKIPEYDADTEDCVICAIRSSEEVSAKLINGCPYLWTDTDTPKLTADEMRDLLMAHRDDLGNREVQDRIGDPNVEFKQSNSTGYDYFYELRSENGEPLYAHITADWPMGKILDAYVCTKDSEDYDNPLVPWVKPQT